MVPSNFHTHTVFCDGKDTPAQMAAEAYRLGCPRLGFSGHAFTPFDTDYCMDPEGTEEYIRQVTALKREYAGRMEIFLGIEQDFYSPASTDGYDYIIGSVHTVLKSGTYLVVDASEQIQKRVVKEAYGGDFYGFCEDYYATVAEVYRKTNCNIVGHFDLITKFNEDGHLFDTGHPRYRAAAEAALDELLKYPCIFEINHGAIPRGYRKTPYMEPWMIEKIEKSGHRLIHTSDCHDRRYLLHGLPQEDIFL